ncbi:caspase family protein [Embleya sp. MST-111070]|uniref:caspase family protein n=1 Tax=Embleya sp. MST-111070 TaxID=3398231 RepID=UPI003F73BBEC
MNLPDPQTSRAVLIGVARYDDLDDLPTVANNLNDLAAMLGGSHSWGLPERNLRVIADPPTGKPIVDVVREAAREATDTLLVYYAGHGLLESDTGELFLSLPESIQGEGYTGLEYRHLRKALLESRAVRRVVILDCCYGGRALGSMGDSQGLAEQAAIEGTFVLTAAHENVRAIAPLDERHTAFTGALLSVVEDGVPGGPGLLDLNTVYSATRERLLASGRPEPQKSDRNTAGRIALAVNRAPHPADVDDMRAWPNVRGETSASGFVRRLAEVGVTCGSSPQVISRRTRGCLAVDDIATLTTLETLPTWAATAAYLAACDVPAEQVTAWRETWLVLRSQVPTGETVRYTRRTRTGSMIALVLFLLVGFGLIARYLAMGSFDFANARPTRLVDGRAEAVPLKLPRRLAFPLIGALAGCILIGIKVFVQKYDLSVDRDEIVLARGPGAFYRHSWHTITHARIVWCASILGRRRGRYFLVLNFESEVHEKTYWFPRRAFLSRKLGGVVAADLTKLDCAPAELKSALALFGGKKLVAAGDASARMQGEPHFETNPSAAAPAIDRTVPKTPLMALTFLLLVMAFTPSVTLLTRVSLERYHWPNLLAVALWTYLLLLPALPVLGALRSPVRLRIDEKGVRYERAGETHHWDWAEITRVGVISWRDAEPATGLLFLQIDHRSTVATRPHRFWVFPRRLSCANEIVVCELFSLGLRRVELERALGYFGRRAWDPGANPERGIIRDDIEELHVEGRTFGYRRYGAILLSFVLWLVVCCLASDPLPPSYVFPAWFMIVAVYSLLLFLLLAMIVSEEAFAVRVDRNALALSVRGRGVRIPWNQIRDFHWRSVDPARPAHRELVLLVDERVIPNRRLLRHCGIRRTGRVLCLVLVASRSCYFPVSTSRLERALSRFSPENYLVEDEGEMNRSNYA